MKAHLNRLWDVDTSETNTERIVVFFNDLMEWSKCLLSNMQVFTAFTVNLTVAWPDAVLSIGAMLQFANFDMFSMSGACMNDLYFYDSMVMKLGTPLILVAIIILYGYMKHALSASTIEGVDSPKPNPNWNLAVALNLNATERVDNPKRTMLMPLMHDCIQV